jgi:putative ABC transport system substrate-binding protein
MTTRRRALAAMLASVAAPAALAQGSRVRRVGVLGVRQRPANPATDIFYGALVEGLRELGYHEGRDVTYTWRFPERRSIDQLPALARELVTSGVDVLVTEATRGALAAKAATQTIPVLFATAADPVASGLVASLARPGGNLSGLTLLVGDTGAKQLEYLLQMLPHQKRVGIVFDDTNPAYRVDSVRKRLEKPARDLGVELVLALASEPARFEAAFADMRARGVRAAVLLADLFYIDHRDRIAELALAHRIALMTNTWPYAEAGALMAYGQDMRMNYRRIAGYVDKVFRGARVAELPVEEPSRFELILNRGTARKLGLAIPDDLLVLANRVIG